MPCGSNDGSDHGNQQRHGADNGLKISYERIERPQRDGNAKDQNDVLMDGHRRTPDVRRAPSHPSRAGRVTYMAGTLRESLDIHGGTRHATATSPPLGRGWPARLPAYDSGPYRAIGRELASSLARRTAVELARMAADVRRPPGHMAGGSRSFGGCYGVTVRRSSPRSSLCARYPRGHRLRP